MADLTVARETPDRGVRSTAPTVAGPRGLEVTQRGYRLRLSAPTAPYGPGRLRFQLLGPDRRPVTAYGTGEQSEPHMFLVQRDMTGYQHLHPIRDAAGTWSAPVDLRAGTYRVFAEFHPAGEVASLTFDAAVPSAGTYRLFLDFTKGNLNRTAEYTAVVERVLRRQAAGIVERRNPSRLLGLLSP